MAQEQAFSMFRGDTKNINLTITDGTDPIDITGASVWLTLKRATTDDDADAIVQKEVTSHTDPTHGETTISISPSDTNDVSPGSYVYDVQLVQSGGDVTTLLVGDFVIAADITRKTQ